jgi:flagellar basal body P-ring formation protein FlgA
MKLGIPAFASLLLFLVLPTADVLARQDPAQVKSAIDAFLRVQVRGLPGEVSYSIGSIDPNNRLIACSALEVAMPAGAKAWGRTSVSVRCQEARGWTIFVPVHIRVITDYLVTAMPLAQGQPVTAGDLARQRGDLSDLPAGILTDEREALGRTASMSVAAGRPLRADMLRQPVVIQQNQTVQVISRGPGFQVTNEGRALTNGLDGQIVQVRLASGQVVSGVARTGGIVEIGF